MRKIIVLADYATDPLALQEIRSSIEGFSRDFRQVRMSFINSTPHTIHTSYLLAQIVYTEERYSEPHETVIFVNVDPRLESSTSVEQAKGAKGLIIKLAAGTYITGPNAGYCFSLIKEKIQAVYNYDILEKGSQFRSRDLYGRVVAHLADNLEQELELDQVSSSLIPTLKGYYIGHIDNYGNLKTTIIKEDFKGKYEYKDVVKIKINSQTQKARFVDNLFGGSVGELVIYPGSSGHIDNPYLEISAWSHFGNHKDTSKTGIDFFPQVKPGDEIKIE